MTKLILFLAFTAGLRAQAVNPPAGGGGSTGSGISYCADATGSTTTYTCTPTTCPTYTAGVTLAFVPQASGAGGATTINVCSLGPKSIKLGDGSTNPSSSTLSASQVYTIVYDGTVFRLTPTSPASTWERYYAAGVCQNTTATSAFSFGTSNQPLAVCVSGANTVYGVTQFTATSQAAYARVMLESYQTGNVDFFLRTRATAITGNQVWALQTACVANAETGDPSFNSAQNLTIATAGTTLQWTSGTQSSLTLTGCSPGEELIVKITLDATTSTTGAIDIITYGWTLRR